MTENQLNYQHMVKETLKKDALEVVEILASVVQNQKLPYEFKLGLLEDAKFQLFKQYHKLHKQL